MCNVLIWGVLDIKHAGFEICWIWNVLNLVCAEF